MARIGAVHRKTSETEVKVRVDLDGRGRCEIDTPVGFFSHMLEQVGRHALLDLTVTVSGDTHVDGHHTVEDTALALGQAVSEALGDRAGIVRYGHTFIPMDEALVFVVLDLSGRPYFVHRGALPKAKIGEFDSELALVFLEGFARGFGANLHVRFLEGENLHHMVEAAFKALAKSLRAAITLDPRLSGEIMSTKGALSESGARVKGDASRASDTAESDGES